ncbi:hypothetical protein [Bradyrhizobium sp. Leo170]|uniref:hypothetical protein n=1 Tax=Bradyrhizobium sp. Leo170 TaxID=1571199 RepID=UPI00102E2606|nr:hypothetical protein [Bradyrhizobium sp. Leo170]
MHDGNAVAVALYRRSRRNPKLRGNLFRYLGRDNLVALAYRERRRPTRALAEWAAQLRAAGRADFDKMMAAVEAERAAKRERAIAAGYSLHEIEPYWFVFKRPDGSLGDHKRHVESDVYYDACSDLERLAVPERAQSSTVA